MKITMSVYLIWVLILGTVHSAEAEEQITGAFGIKLGQIYPPENCISEGGVCKFEPEKKVRAFTDYQVSGTTISHKVYNITASGDMKSLTDCIEEQGLIMAALEKKYGEMVELPSNVLFQNIREISQGHRSVRTFCSNKENLHIIYVDKRLLSTAIAEEDRKKEEVLRKKSEVIDTTDL